MKEPGNSPGNSNDKPSLGLLARIQRAIKPPNNNWRNWLLWLAGVVVGEDTPPYLPPGAKLHTLGDILSKREIFYIYVPYIAANVLAILIPLAAIEIYENYSKTLSLYLIFLGMFGVLGGATLSGMNRARTIFDAMERLAPNDEVGIMLESIQKQFRLIPKSKRGRPAGMIYIPGKGNLTVTEALPDLAELQAARERGELRQACKTRDIEQKTAERWLRNYQEQITEWRKNSG